MTHPSDIRNRNVTIVGAAESGIAAALLVQQHGAGAFVTEKRTLDQVASDKTILRGLRALEEAGIPFELGGHSERAEQCSIMVVNPGVPRTIPLIAGALARGTVVMSELELASRFCPGAMIAITGTNGKTTTTTLVGRILTDAHRPAVVAGNIRPAFSSVVEGMTPETTAVLEASSYQLELVDTFRPVSAALLNITRDHMSRYNNSMEEYAAAKANIWRNFGPSDPLVYNDDDEWTRKTVAPARCWKLPFSRAYALAEGAFIDNGMLTVVLDGRRRDIIETERISIKGPHNVENALAAALLGMLAGVGAASIRSTLINFKGVEHRLEFVAELDGVGYVNDSKATNIDSTWYALQSFAQPLIVLVGGREEGNDYARLFDLVRRNVRSIVAIGETADKVMKSFEGIVPVVKAASMEEAVAAGAKLAHAGDCVLLSPACKSFDWYHDYEERGRDFKRCVLARAGRVEEK